MFLYQKIELVPKSCVEAKLDEILYPTRDFYALQLQIFSEKDKAKNAPLEYQKNLALPQHDIISLSNIIIYSSLLL